MLVGGLAVVNALLTGKFTRIKSIYQEFFPSTTLAKPVLGMEETDPDYVAHVQYLAGMDDRDPSAVHKQSGRPIPKLEDKNYAAVYLRAFGSKKTKE